MSFFGLAIIDAASLQTLESVYFFIFIFFSGGMSHADAGMVLYVDIQFSCLCFSFFSWYKLNSSDGACLMNNFSLLQVQIYF